MNPQKGTVVTSSNKKLSIEVPARYWIKGWEPAPELQKAIQDTADVYENLPFMPEKYPKLKVNVVPEKGTAYLPSGTVGAHYQAVPAHLLPEDDYRYWLGVPEPDGLGIYAAGDRTPAAVSSTFAHELGHADNDRLTRFFQEHPQILAEFPRYTDPKGDWYARDRSFARSPKSRSAAAEST